MKNVVLINPPYSFISDIEPSEEQLGELMSKASLEVKQRAKLADEKLAILQKEQIEEAFRKYHIRYGKK